MSELVMKMFGLNDLVKGGQAMADRLNKSGVKNIKVVGRGAVIVDPSTDPEKSLSLGKQLENSSSRMQKLLQPLKLTQWTMTTNKCLHC